VELQLRAIQQRAGAPRKTWIRSSVVAQNPASREIKPVVLSAGTIGAVGLALSVSLAFLVESIARRRDRPARTGRRGGKGRGDGAPPPPHEELPDGERSTDAAGRGYDRAGEETRTGAGVGRTYADADATAPHFRRLAGAGSAKGAGPGAADTGPLPITRA
jgi:hypothetical protein